MCYNVIKESGKGASPYLALSVSASLGLIEALAGRFAFERIWRITQAVKRRAETGSGREIFEFPLPQSCSQSTATNRPFTPLNPSKMKAIASCRMAGLPDWSGPKQYR